MQSQYQAARIKPECEVYTYLFTLYARKSVLRRRCMQSLMHQQNQLGVSFNETGPAIHSPLLDVLLHFRMHKVALIQDVSSSGTD